MGVRIEGFLSLRDLSVVGVVGPCMRSMPGPRSGKKRPPPLPPTGMDSSQWEEERPPPSPPTGMAPSSRLEKQLPHILVIPVYSYGKSVVIERGKGKKTKVESTVVVLSGIYTDAERESVLRTDTRYARTPDVFLFISVHIYSVYQGSDLSCLLTSACVFDKQPHLSNGSRKCLLYFVFHSRESSAAIAITNNTTLMTSIPFDRGKTPSRAASPKPPQRERPLSHHRHHNDSSKLHRQSPTPRTWNNTPGYGAGMAFFYATPGLVRQVPSSPAVIHSPAGLY